MSTQVLDTVMNNNAQNTSVVWELCRQIWLNIIRQTLERTTIILTKAVKPPGLRTHELSANLASGKLKISLWISHARVTIFKQLFIFNYDRLSTYTYTPITPVNTITVRSIRNVSFVPSKTVRCSRGLSSVGRFRTDLHTSRKCDGFYDVPRNAYICTASTVRFDTHAHTHIYIYTL